MTMKLIFMSNADYWADDTLEDERSISSGIDQVVKRDIKGTRRII